MASPTLARWGGLGAILAGVLFAASSYIHEDEGSPSYFFALTEAGLYYIVPLLFSAGLAGLYTRCRGRAGWLGGMGFVVSFLAVGQVFVYRFVDVYDCCYAHVVAGWSPVLLEWLPWLYTGLILVGIATIKTEALRGHGALSLAMGAFGWVFYLTDSGGIIETRFGHTAFGVLFSLSWMVLGYMLWLERGMAHQVIGRTS